MMNVAHVTMDHSRVLLLLRVVGNTVLCDRKKRGCVRKKSLFLFVIAVFSLRPCLWREKKKE